MADFAAGAVLHATGITVQVTPATGVPSGFTLDYFLTLLSGRRLNRPTFTYTMTATDITNLTTVVTALITEITATLILSDFTPTPVIRIVSIDADSSSADFGWALSVTHRLVGSSGAILYTRLHGTGLTGANRALLAAVATEAIAAARTADGVS